MTPNTKAPSAVRSYNYVLLRGLIAVALRKKVTAVGNSAAIVLSRDLLQLLDLEIGAELELSVTDKTLVVRSAREVERSERIKAAADRVFERRRPNPDRQSLELPGRRAKKRRRAPTRPSVPPFLPTR